MVFVFGVFVWMVTEREGLLWALFKHCSNCRSAGKAVPVPCFGGCLKVGGAIGETELKSL